MSKGEKEVKRGKVDYIRVIYELDGEDGNGVRSVDISRRFNISKASVSEMLGKLSREDLVKAKKYSNVHLTNKGKKLAEELFENHKAIKQYLMKHLGHNDEVKAYQEAHELEHAFSPETIEKLKRIVGIRKTTLPTPVYVG